MNENKNVAQSEIILTGNYPAINVELSLKEIQNMLGDDSPVMTFTDINGMHYLIPKMIIKLFRSLAQ